MGWPNITLMPVTPFAMNRVRYLFAYQWTCISHRPGIRNFPLASTTSAPCGTGTAFPIPAIRGPAITTVMSNWGSGLVGWMTATWVNTRKFCLAGGAWGAVPEDKNRQKHAITWLRAADRLTEWNARWHTEIDRREPQLIAFTK